jgi:hypothetical protein
MNGQQQQQGMCIG